MKSINIIKIATIFAFSIKLALSQTTVIGDVSGTWTSSGNPYYVTGDINVPNGETLIIAEGVEINFIGVYSFTIRGLLKAEGTEANKIIFYGDGGAGSWKNIYFSQNANFECILSHCIIRDGGYESGANVYFYNNSKITIQSCEIWNSAGSGILVEAKQHGGDFVENVTRKCTPVIKDNIIHNNEKSGILVSAYYTGSGFAEFNTTIAQPTIYNNMIYENSENGVECNAYSSAGSNGSFTRGITVKTIPRIYKNTIYNNGMNGIICNRTVAGYYYETNVIRSNPFVSTNILSRNIEYGLDANGFVDIDSVKHNDFFNNGIAALSGIDGGLGQKSRKNLNGDSCDVNLNIFFDPQFVDEINRDFHLQSTSKCIDAGDLNLEYDPDNTFSDIGAYFYNQQKAILTVSPLEIDFGQSLIGATTLRKATIANDGDGVLEVSSIFMAGKDSTKFIVDTLAFSLEPAETRDIDISYHPENVEYNFASVEIESNGGTASVLLLGSGTFVIFDKKEDSPMYTDGGASLGSAWADYDNDGDQDLFVSNYYNWVTGEEDAEKNFLYNNQGDGTFNRITSGSLVQDVNFSQGCSWGDYDNDGYPDLFVSNTKNENNNLYKNNGNGTFTKIISGSIVEDGGASSGCSWIDYNNDGYLDLFVANASSGNNFLYKNTGDGSFDRINDGPVVNDAFYTVGCSWADYDNDGDIDLLTVNLGEEGSRIYVNNGDGTFDVDIDNPVSQKDGLGGSWGDYDNDGDQDLIITRFTNNTLFRNTGNGAFDEVETGPVVNDHGDSRGSCWADFDNDGDLDLFVSNAANLDTARHTNILYFNLGDGTFIEEVSGHIVSDSSASYSPSAADFDNDGDIDLFVCNLGGEPRNILYENKGNDNNWVNILCEGSYSNRSAIGTKVFLKATIFGKSIWQYREVSSQTGGGQSSQNSLNVEFGLGDAAYIDSIKVIWPSGRTNFLTDISPNQILKVFENNRPFVVEAIADTSFYEDSGPFVVVQDLDSVFNDPDNDNLSYSAVSGNEQISVFTNSDSLIVHTNTDYYGQSHIIVTAVDTGGLATNDTFLVNIKPVDDQPFPFLLLLPSDGDTLESVVQPLVFVWYKSKEVDGDTLLYTLRLFQAGFDTTITGISDTTYLIESPTFLEHKSKYSWSVLADDMHSFVSSDTFALYTPEPVNLDEMDNGIPKMYALGQNYPNPFNPFTSISFALPKAGNVSLKIYNLLGQNVATLLDMYKPAGYHKVIFDGSRLSSGVYYYRLQADGFVQVKKMLLVK